MDPTSLLFFSILSVAVASPTDEAHSALLNAYLKQSGIQSNLDRMGKHYEHQVPEETRVYLGYAAYISKTVIDKRIVFKWSFK
jgi:hypothetical protein